MRIEKIHGKNLNNTRDLGGFPVSDGRKIKYGLLIRSGRLSNLPKKTLEKLNKYNIQAVIDMRTDREISEHPTTPLNGAKFYHLPLICTATTGITHQKSMAKVMYAESKRIKSEFGTADNYMQCMYRLMLFSDECREPLKKFFEILIETDGCILWHCNAGKDRTGLTAMLLEGVLGVDEELIIRDYSLSSHFRRKLLFVQNLGLFISPLPLRFKRILKSMMYSKPQYISGAIHSIKEKYGSITEYCKQHLSLTDEQILKLKDKYLE